MILLTLGLIVISLILFLKHIYSHWERKGVPYIPPQIPFGNLKNVAKRKRSFGLCIYDLYKQTTQPFIGIYLFFRPAILIHDPQLARQILVQDFTSFHDRGIYCDEKRDPMSGTLFALPGAKWKALRNNLTPLFTSGKLKSMFPTILDVGKKLQKYMEPFAVRKETINIRDISSRYSLDINASVIFGFEINSVENPDHEFRDAIKRLTKPSVLNGLRAAAVFLCPKLLSFLRINGLPGFVREFMLKIVRTQIEMREEKHFSRKDFMQLLLQLRNTGKIQEDGDWDIRKDSMQTIKSMSIEQCAGQAFVFYIAGTETSASTIAFCLHELTQNPPILQQLRTEIDTILEKYNGDVSYDCIMEMKYLELCILETLRKYPGLPILNRECTKDYQIPGSKLTIEKGTPIVISLFGIQRDPTIFPNPDKFDPERFSDENRGTNDKFSMPFGDGPRNCIAFRLGKLVSKVCLVLLLSKFNFVAVNDKEFEFEAGTVPLVVVGGIPLKITKR